MLFKHRKVYSFKLRHPQIFLYFLWQKKTSKKIYNNLFAYFEDDTFLQVCIIYFDMNSYFIYSSTFHLNLDLKSLKHVLQINL